MEKKDREVRKKEILCAALKCFSKKGYHDTTMEDIVQEAGLSKGAIYWYFKNKRELFLALIKQHLQEEGVLWEEVLKEHKSISDLLKKFGRLFLKSHLEDEKIGPFFAEFAAEAYRDEKIRKGILKSYEHTKDRFREIFDRFIKEGGMIKDIDSESLVFIIFAVMNRLIEGYWIIGKKLSYEKIWNTFVKALSEGIQKRRQNETGTKG